MNNVTLGHISKQKLKEGLGTVGKEVVGTQWQCTVVFSITVLTNTLIHITNTCRPFPKCERFHEIHKNVIVNSDGLKILHLKVSHKFCHLEWQTYQFRI